MNFFNIKSITLVGVILLAFGCGGSKNSQEDASSEFEEVKEKVAVDFQKILKDVPPLSKVPYLLKEANAELDATLINSIDDIDRYQGDLAKAALNLGIYSSDIAYLVSYGESKAALDIMGECQKLAGTVGLTDVVDYALVARFERNIEDNDSLVAIVDEIMLKSREKLVELDQLDGFALLLTGSWIEGLYLANSIVASYPEELPHDERIELMTPLLKIVLDQEQSLDKLLKMMKSIPPNNKIEIAVKNLEKIKAGYHFELEEVKTAINGFTDDYILRPSAIATFAKEVSNIRTRIIE